MDNSVKTFPWLNNYDTHVPETIAYPDATIHEVFEQMRASFTDCVFLQFGDSAYTYEETGKKIDALRSYLQHCGIKKGDRIGVALPNIPQFVISFYAIVSAGAVVVAMNPRYTKSEFEDMIEKAGIRTVICLEDQKEIFRTIAEKQAISEIIITSLAQGKDLSAGSDGLDLDPSTDEECICFLDAIRTGLTHIAKVPIVVNKNDAAIFQFSGGTTGTPKPAIGTHKNLVANSLQFSAWCDLKKGEEVILAVIPLYHVYGMVLAMNMGATIGAKIVLIVDPRNVEHILTSIEEHQVTFYPGVPTMYHAINAYMAESEKEVNLHSIKACISGSFTLHPEIKRNFEGLTGGRLMEGYGLSEAPTATHCNPLTGRNKAGSIGMPLPDVEAKIVDIDTGRRTLSVGEVGELVIRGPQVMQEYFEQPEETAATLRDGWLYTGDIAKMDEDGYFFLVDRKKSLIKVGGLQVWPNEIEKVIDSHADVKACGTAGVPDKVQGERVVCWIVLEKDKVLDADGLDAWCREQLAAYKVPTEYIVVDALPRTGVGKILRRKLIESYKKSAD